MAWFHLTTRHHDDDRPATVEDLRQLGSRFRRLCILVILFEVSASVALCAYLSPS